MGFTSPSFWRVSTPPTTAALNEQRALDATATLELEGAQDQQSKTISSGSISPTAAYVIVDTEGSAAADDLGVISPVLSASENLHVGMIIYLRAADSGRVVTVKNSSGANGINTYDGNDYVLSTTHWLKLQLRADGKWYEVEGRAMETALAAASAAAAAATAADHAQTKSGTSSTASGTAAKVVTCAGFKLSTNARVVVKFSNANTVANAITLNVNGTGAESVYNQTGIISTTNTALFAANQPIEFRYDGTGWVFYDASLNAQFVADLTASLDTTRQGSLLCNGGAYSRTTYAALFAILGTSFGAGDGSTTFNVPDFRDKTIQGANANLKAVIAAGLPNITGTISPTSDATNLLLQVSTSIPPTGAFAAANTNVSAYNVGGTGVSDRAVGISIDASRSSSKYGASTTVQPPAIAANIFIKY